MTAGGWRYEDCGLNSVRILNADFVTDDASEKVICVPAINLLHRTIAEGILRRPSRISGKELRFLRTEMGLTQAQLADLLHRDEQTIARWEKEKSEIDGNADTLVRLIAGERLGIDLGERVETIARWSTPAAGSREILIERTKDGYALMRDAA